MFNILFSKGYKLNPNMLVKVFFSSTVSSAAFILFHTHQSSDVFFVILKFCNNAAIIKLNPLIFPKRSKRTPMLSSV